MFHRLKLYKIAFLLDTAFTINLVHSLSSYFKMNLSFSVSVIVLKPLSLLPDLSISIWAPSSEFVSSNIPSWQILTAHAQPFRGARDLAFCLKVPLDSLLVWASSEGSGETARMRSLAWTFAARLGDKYQIRLTRSICLKSSYTWQYNKKWILLSAACWSQTWHDLSSMAKPENLPVSIFRGKTAHLNCAKWDLSFLVMFNFRYFQSHNLT